MIVTGVGRRKSPPLAISQGRQLASLLVRHGHHIRTGEAGGMDQAFREGVDHVDPSFKRVYTARDTRWCEARGKEYIACPESPLWGHAMAIASSHHPNWEAVKRNHWALMLHSRNPFQVLGEDLNSPSDALIFWAPPIAGSTRVIGGTNTSVAIALEWDIPVFNLYYPETFDKLIDTIEEKGFVF